MNKNGPSRAVRYNWVWLYIVKRFRSNYSIMINSLVQQKRHDFNKIALITTVEFFCFLKSVFVRQSLKLDHFNKRCKNVTFFETFQLQSSVRWEDSPWCHHSDHQKRWQRRKWGDNLIEAKNGQKLDHLFAVKNIFCMYKRYYLFGPRSNKFDVAKHKKWRQIKS